MKIILFIILFLVRNVNLYRWSLVSIVITIWKSFQVKFSRQKSLVQGQTWEKNLFFGLLNMYESVLGFHANRMDTALQFRDLKYQRHLNFSSDM